MIIKLRKKLSAYRAVVLDMDGTLYYQFPLRVCMVFALFWHCVLHPLKMKELLIIIAFRKLRESDLLVNSVDFETQQYELLSQQFGLSREYIQSVISLWMEEKPLKYIRLCRDRKLLKFLMQLKNNGAKLVLYSDYPVVKKLQVLHPFDVDYCCCASDLNIGFVKPNVQGIEAILKMLGEPAEHVVFIGDRYEKDGRSAESVGMDYIIMDKNPLMRWARSLFCSISAK
jgi:FMN phosphatase YigB (HAD superfamily)